MRFPRLSIPICSIAFVVNSLCAPSADAAVVQVDVAGTVTGIDDHSSIMFTYAPFANLAIGDTVTGSWVYDTSTPYGPVPISGSPFGYFIQSMNFSTGGGMGAYANFSGGGLATFLLPGTGRLFPDQSYGVSLQFAPDYFDAIPPSALDTNALIFGSIFGIYSSIPNDYISFSANVTSVIARSVVPLPAAAWLFASALLGLLGLQRSRRGGQSVESVP